MNTIFYYYFLGPIILCALYALCFFLVVGIKVFSLIFVPKKPSVQRFSKEGAKKSNPKTRSSVKSIEIDPDYIDRIYVKKSS